MTNIAIIGLSGIFPQAENLQAYWENLINKVDCITEVPPTRWNINDYYDINPKTPDKTYCKRGGFMPDIEFNPMEFGLPPNILEVTDVAQLLSLVVAKQVLIDAGYENADESIRKRTGVILGVGGGQKLITPLTSRLQYPIWLKVLKSSGLSEEDTQNIIEKIKLAYVPWEENSFPGMLGNVIAGRIANRLDLGGINCVVDAACASSLSALRMALSELTEYRSDMMITGGVDTDNSIFMYMSFSKTPAFSQQGQIRPFDAQSDGMLIGEAIGMMVLKRLEDAEKDGDRIYAVIKGMGTSSDGKYKSIYAPRSSGQAIALNRAYQEAGFTPQTVSLIEAHGTGTIAGDQAEFTALNEVFGADNPQKQYIALGSVKSQIGHTKSAAGAASLIKVALGLYHKILPPTINVTQPNPKFNIENSPFYLNTETRPWFPIDNQTPRRGSVSSFGFGGTNFHVVLEEYQQEHNQYYRLHKSIDSILLYAPNPQELLTKISLIKTHLESDHGAEHYQKLIKISHPIPLKFARVGFVTQSLVETIEILTIIIEYLKNNLTQDFWEHNQGIFYRKNGLDLSGKIVALFSGQGSQYLEMGKELALNYPIFREYYQLMDNCLLKDNLTPISRIVFPFPTFDQQQKNAQIDALQKTENAQPAIGAFSMGVYKILENAGFKPDFVAGHSFGELTALWAAEVLTDDDYCFLVKSRGKAMAVPLNSTLDAGKMLAVKGNVEQIIAIINNSLDVTIANYNSHNQIVLAGKNSAIIKVKETLDKLGFTTILLPVSAAFHTNLVSHAQNSFAQAIKRVKFNPPKISIYSNLTANLYPENHQEIKEFLIKHIVNPVRFKEQIENIYNAGGTCFVEFGQKNILTNLVKNILGDRNHLALSLNQTGNNAEKQLKAAVIQLQVAGLTLNNIDLYQSEQKQYISVQQKGVTVCLNGANYVSEKTKTAFVNALKDGHQIKYENQEQEKSQVSDNISIIQSNSTLNDENEIADQFQNISASQTSILNSENSVDTNLNLSPSNIKSEQKPMPQSPLNNQSYPGSFERLMMRFYDHQAEVSRVQEQYLKNQEKTAQQFLQLMQQQYTGLSSDNITVEPVITNHFSEEQELIPLSFSQDKPQIENNKNQQINPVSSSNIAVNSSITTSISENIYNVALDSKQAEKLIIETENNEITTLADSELANLTQSLLEVVSDKTGYPIETLELEMDIEADLGIDSIKRVEILGAMLELFPDLPPVNPEIMGELRTLTDIVNYISQGAKNSEKKT